MRQVTFDTPVLRVEGLEVKFDIIPVSSSLAVLLGSRDLAQIVQQLHYWTLSGYGEVIDGVRWIYKSIKEWIAEVFPTFTPYQLSKLMAQLVEREIVRREKLFTKHQIQKGDRFWWQPKNQTYYYSLNTEKLQELAANYQSSVKEAEPPETSVFIKTQILSDREIEDTKFSDCPKNNTKNTSIENISKDQSHPTLPSECEVSVESNQDEQQFSKPELDSLKEERPWRGDLAQGTRSDEESKKVDSVTSKAVEKDISSAQVEEKVNKYMDTRKVNVQEPVRATQALEATSKDAPSQVEKAVSKPKRSKTPGGARSHGSETSPGSHLKGTKPKRKDKAPWKDEGQFKRFYRALVQALPQVANAHSPQGLAQTIIRQLRSGIPHSYWDDFIAGLPIGTSTMPEWEVEPGVPYPMFIEYLTEKIKAGNNTESDEQTRNEVFRILSKPRQAKAFWGQFKRSVVNVSEQVERDRALGVSNPNTPVWTRERIEPSIEEAAAAGEKIMAVNGTTGAAIESGEITGSPVAEVNSATRTTNNRANLSESSSPTKFLEVPDPWTDESESQSATSQPTMRELLTKRLGDRNLKGFVKAMPKVSKSEAEAEERAEKKPKTNISQMSVAEINDYLADSVLRKQIMPQLWHSDYELITNDYGEIIGVRRPSST